MNKYAVLLLLGTLGAFACRPADPSATQAAARIGTVTITQEDLQNSLSYLSEQDRTFAQTPLGKQNLLQILTREKLILQDARTQGLDQQKDFTRLLEQKRAELEDIYQRYSSEMLERFWYEKNSKALEPGEKEIKEYFEKYPYEMTIKQIIVDNAQTADQVLRALKSSPGRWQEISRQYSIAPEPLRKLTVMPGEYLESLEVIAANTPVGKVQGFFKTPQGFHIIMKTAENRLAFTDAQPRIRQVLLQQHLDRLLDSLKTKYEVIIYDKNE